MQGLTVASPANGGAVYVVDCSPSDDGSTPCSVKAFSRQGDYLLTIGGPGQGPGQVRDAGTKHQLGRGQCSMPESVGA